MEEVYCIRQLILQFQSNLIEELYVTLFIQNGVLIANTTLFKNQQSIIQLNKNAISLYGVIQLENRKRNYFFQLQLTENQTIFQKQFNNSEFSIKIIAEVQKQTQVVLSSLLKIETENTAKQIAKKNTNTLLTKIMDKLSCENEINIHIRKPKQLTKNYVRKNMKKNLTTIFYRNQNNEIKKVQDTPELHLGQLSLKVLDKNPNCNINDHLKEMETPIKQDSTIKIDSFKATIDNGQDFSKNLIEFSQTKVSSIKDQRDSIKINQRTNEKNINKLCQSRLKFIRTLQNQTLRQLKDQKQEIIFLQKLRYKQNFLITTIEPKQMNKSHQTSKSNKKYNLIKNGKKTAIIRNTKIIPKMPS